MPQFAANLSMLFSEYAFPTRFEHAAAAGFKGVEFLFPYEYSANEIKQWLDDQQLNQILFNLPPGRWQEGERGIACLPNRKSEFQESVHLALEYAQVLGNQLLHCMAGIVPEALSNTKAMDCYKENLLFAANLAANTKHIICIEPINHFDMPGYLLNYSQQAVDIIQELDQKNLCLQYDIYHAQRMEGHLSQRLQQLLPYIAHIQIANTPGRHEPDHGEINYSFIFNWLQEIGYKGWIGCEYNPTSTTIDGLDWFFKLSNSR